MAAQRVRVYVADDHPLYREGVVRALRMRPDFELVGEAGDGRAALEQVRTLAPDVAVLDLRLPGLDGIEITEALRREGSPTRVLMLSAFLESAVVYRAVAAGASAYLSKDADGDAICDAVAAVAEGRSVFSPEVQSGLAEQIRASGASERPVLSPRELEVLRLLAAGRSDREIGGTLFLSHRTVMRHVATILAKLEVENRTAAAKYALGHGLA